MKIWEKLADELKGEKLQPWKVEREILENYGVSSPDHFRMAALARRRFIEEITGEKFHFIGVPDKPYLMRYYCEKNGLIWELAAEDAGLKCSLCGGGLKPFGSEGERYAPLVSNYVGGREDYYSYAGRMKVNGSVEKEFVNLLQYGTGKGPIGITRGCYIINRFGGIKVKVSPLAGASRNLSYIFSSSEDRQRAIGVIERVLPRVRNNMEERLKEFGGKVATVEFLRAEDCDHSLLYVDFTADFENFRGHGDVSNAVGYAKKILDRELTRRGVRYEMSVIAQGYDGDLKPSPRNKRGRYVCAQARIPVTEVEAMTGKNIEKFLAYIHLDALGVEKLGWFGYTGMGGEIIPGMYKATKINPHAPLVSAMQKIFASVEGDRLIYGVELPNVEAGVVSCREGLVPPMGREAMRIMGIQTAAEFAACLAGQILAGEFNLAIVAVSEELYRSP
ncbi:hypothetical protein ISS37_08345 [candidate division KSB1 bacterium]|nr:hypothetical protein [candidate division KSB1 bacterium]